MNKQIEDLEKTLYDYRFSYDDCVAGSETDLAKFLVGQGYQKVDKDKQVVLSREEFEKGVIERESMRKQITELFNDREKARKETAEKFLNMIYWKAVKHIKGKNKDECFIEMSFEKLDEIAKQFGVEIKE